MRARPSPPARARALRRGHSAPITTSTAQATSTIASTLTRAFYRCGAVRTATISARKAVTARCRRRRAKIGRRATVARRGDADASTGESTASGARARIERDVETLAGAAYTLSAEAIRRYAYTDVYGTRSAYFERALKTLGFGVELDPVGTLVARNRPRGEPVFGIGSHCDSNRNGGKYDGTMGVVCALEVCRLNDELGLGLPLQLISFLEEEGSGFGQMLLGSRIVAQRVTEEELRETFRAVDDGRSFWEHAEEAGFEPARWRDAAHVLDGPDGLDRDAHRAGDGCCRTPATASASSAPSPDTSTPT